MNLITGENFNSIYRDILLEIQSNGKLEGKTRDITELIFRLDDPTRYQLFHKKNWMWAYVELVDRFSGENPGTAYNYRPAWKRKLAKEDGKFHYAYGPVWIRQVGAVIKQLKKQKTSREAIMNLWESKYLLRQEDFNRRPCTLTYHFYIRNKKLNLSVNMRSNDVINLLPYDVMHNCLLQQYVAAGLGIELGYYFHHSSHAYWPKKREREGRGYIPELINKISDSEKFHDFKPSKIESCDDVHDLCYNWEIQKPNETYQDNFTKNWASLIFKHNNFDNQLKYLQELK